MILHNTIVHSAIGCLSSLVARAHDYSTVYFFKLCIVSSKPICAIHYYIYLKTFVFVFIIIFSNFVCNLILHFFNLLILHSNNTYILLVKIYSFKYTLGVKHLPFNKNTKQLLPYYKQNEH